MGRGRRGFFDDLAKRPWPVALAVGIAGFAGMVRPSDMGVRNVLIGETMLIRTEE